MKNKKKKPKTAAKVKPIKKRGTFAQIWYNLNHMGYKELRIYQSVLIVISMILIGFMMVSQGLGDIWIVGMFMLFAVWLYKEVGA